MKNKKTISAFAALLILIFHLWINLTNSTFELFLRNLCVIGVDLFFFISGYTISSKNINYKKFIKNRFKNIYLKFVIFAVFSLLLSGLSFNKFILTITGIGLFKFGGGSFLWFIPAIMIVYILLPLYKKIDNKYSKTSLITITSYILLSVIFSYTSYDKLFIFTNRIPIILLGYYASKYDIISHLEKNNKKYYLVSITLILLGLIVSYIEFIYKIKFAFFKDIFYLINIPLILGLILILNKIKPNKVINIISKISLEVYALQMIVGYKIMNYLYLSTNNILLCDIAIIFILVGISYIFNYAFDLIIKKVIEE